MPAVRCEKCGAKNNPLDSLGKCVVCGVALPGDWYGVHAGKIVHLDPETQKAQQEKPPLDRTGALVFCYSWRYRSLSLLVTFLAPALFYGFFPVMEGRRMTARDHLIPVPWTLIGALVTWNAMWFRLRVTPEGLDCRGWRGHRVVHWESIQEVSFCVRNHWFIIHASDGWKFRVAVFVCGLPDFLEQCEGHLPRTALTSAKPGYALLGRGFPEAERGPTLSRDGTQPERSEGIRQTASDQLLTQVPPASPLRSPEDVRRNPS
jgi:hypothetical protein